MKSLSSIQRMRGQSGSFRGPMVLLYLLLSMAAAWHAPHDLHSSSSEKAIEASSAPVNSAVDPDGFCALCSWQATSQETASVAPAVVTSLPLEAAPGPSVVPAPIPGFTLAHLARGPPSV